MKVQVRQTIDDINAGEWNRLAGDDPFLKQEFLAALEHSGSACAASGWQPQHLTCTDGSGRLVGALPLYLKSHSFGEYVFDWAWADAWQRAGLPYYPKFTSAVPFSPVPGQRLLIDPLAERASVINALLTTCIELAETSLASSVHCLFPQEQELNEWTNKGFLLRKDCQYHWHNYGYADFENWLATFTAEKRKKVHRERRRIREAGIDFIFLGGNDLDKALLDTIYAFYADTYHKRGRTPYLTREFFSEIVRTLPGSLLIILAKHRATPVAVAICFRNHDTLYGRHWGCGPEFHSLHFETCYYQGIEYCLANGLNTFNPGTQGEHKLARGFEPTATWSAHWIADLRLRAAVADFLRREAGMMNAYIQDAERHLPFHKQPL
ncbi:MAG TPA: GNAT family N-acetyltransferase [Gammaproteobacteria bacterium]|nr:GNAT family N-acetyltransferase [Gammaproteobacteria bacterium]